jgi:threonine dehydratase
MPVVRADVVAAAEGLGDAVLRSPCLRSATLSAITGADVWLKFENLQYTASFKERGARWFLLGLDDATRAAGVVAASAGNHAQGLARHARLLGIPSTIVMPESTPFTKITRTEFEGATVMIHGLDFAAAQAHALALAEAHGATFVPAFDDARIIAGQGTIGLELLDQVPNLDTVVVPVGGGGLIAGISSALADTKIRIVGVQSETHPGFARELGNDVEPVATTTIAEGIAVKQPGAQTLEIARRLVAGVFVVRESTLESAVGMLLEIEKTVVEGAGAAGLAALLDHPESFTDRRCALILSGGNIDPRTLSEVLLRALSRSGRLVRLACHLPDRPGQLARVAEIVGDLRGNIVDVEHHRDRPGVAVRDIVLELSIETRDAEHAVAIADALRAAGIDVVDAT